MDPPLDAIQVGDTFRLVHDLPAQSIDTVWSSPPYFGQRDYRILDVGTFSSVDEAEAWSESAAAEFQNNQISCHPDVMWSGEKWLCRVLLDDPNPYGMESTPSEYIDRTLLLFHDLRRVLKPWGTVWWNVGDTYLTYSTVGHRNKELALIPFRLAIALVDEGWLPRNVVAWCKNNTMPSSVRDRLSCAWEPIFLLAHPDSGGDYYFNLDKIRQPHKSEGTTNWKQGLENGGLSHTTQAGHRARLTVGDGGLGRTKAISSFKNYIGHPLGKNPRDHINTVRLGSEHQGHFATQPEALVHRFLPATLPRKVCCACGRPQGRYFKVNERSTGDWRTLAVQSGRPSGDQGVGRSGGNSGLRGARGAQEGTWVAYGCDCRAPTRPGIVLDPFMGSGTTALVAKRLRCHFIGFDRNPRYAALTHERLARESHPLFEGLTP